MEQSDNETLCLLVPLEDLHMVVDPIHISNAIARTMQVLGAIGLLGSLAVILVIVGNSRDRRHFRDRILLGLFCATAIFSIGNIIPSNIHGTSCSDWTMIVELEDPAAFCYLGSVWYSGNFMTASYELFLIVSSIAALRSGTINLKPRFEIIGHLLCFIIALVVLISAGATCYSVYVAGYYEESLGNIIGALNSYSKYEEILQRMLVGWIPFFGIVLSLWIYQRAYMTQLRKDWAEALNKAERQWDRDLWDRSNPKNESERQRKRLLVELQREAFEGFTKPLDPFVITFLIFSIPSAVMASDYCHKINSNPLKVNCNISCMLVLACRPLVVVSIYFKHYENREAVFNIKTLLARLGSRIARRLGHVVGGRVQFNRDLEVRVIEPEDEYDPERRFSSKYRLLEESKLESEESESKPNEEEQASEGENYSIQ